MIKRNHYWVCQVYAGEHKGKYFADFGVPTMYTADVSSAMRFSARKRAIAAIKLYGSLEKPVKVF